MPSEWREVEFGSVLDGGTRNGLYKSPEFHGSGAKMVNMGELFGNPRLGDVPMRRVRVTDREADNFSLRQGDLLFARRSLVAEGAGKCSIVMRVSEPTVFESSIIRARPEARIADSWYLYYLFSSPLGQYLLDTIRRQVAVAGITGSDLVKLRIPLPSLPVQRSIARILGALDDKIELNRKMNETLEQMARAIFKSWFVDFEPFPDKGMVDSPLGRIPRGWRVGTLDDILAELETGSRPDGGVAGIRQGVPSVGAESILGAGVFDFSKTKYVAREFYSSMNKGRAVNGDVLLYKDGGRPGEYEPHVSVVGEGFPFSEFAINEHVYRMQVRADLGQAFLYLWLTSPLVMDEMRMKGTGVAIPGLNSTNVRSLAVLIADEATHGRFDELARPLVRALLLNAKNSRVLAAIRDALLPKLMSGEVRVA